MSNEAFEKEFDSQEAPAHYSHEEACAWSIGASYGWQAAKADSEREIAELKAHINDLRETLKQISFYSEIDWIQNNIEQILEKTPAQSLQEHDNEVIEKCAKVCDGYTHGVWFADNIRALKGK